MSAEGPAAEITNGQFCRMIETLTLFRPSLGAYVDPCKPCDSPCQNDCYVGVPNVYPGNMTICNPCYKGTKDDIIVDGFFLLQKPVINGKITVKSSGVLNIIGNHQFSKNSQIIIEFGGEAVISGAQLDNCAEFPNEKWHGIRSKGKVTINKQSVISNAYIALENNKGFFDVQNSRFSACDYGIRQESQNTTLNIINKVIFSGGTLINIEVSDNKFLDITDCNFSSGNGIGIKSNNSVVNISNCDFEMSTSIIINSTVPNLTGSTIVGNRFFSKENDLPSDVSIFLEGLANLVPHDIQGNFFGNNGIGIWNLGITSYNISMNDFYCDHGVRSWDNGLDKSQMVLNNTFGCITNGGEATGQNDAEFNDNCFDYSQEAYIKLNRLSSINENQGDFGPGSFEAGNCFAPGLIKNIGVSSPITPFNYHIWTNTPLTSCKDPKGGLTYFTAWDLLKDSEEQSNGISCGSGQWVTNLPPHIKYCIIPKDLQAKKNMEIALRKEYWRIYLNSSLSPRLKKWLLNRIKRCYKLLLGQLVTQIRQEENRQAAISVLDSFPSFHNKILAYSLFIDDDEIANARNYLNTIPYNNTEAIDFKTTQNIYLDYLSNKLEYQLSQSDKNLLFHVGVKHDEYSSFARAIYHLLTGQRILPDLNRVDQLSEEGSPRFEKVVRNKIDVYPNPTIGDVIKVEIDMPNKIKYEASLYNLDGRTIYSSMLENGLNRIDIQHIESGMYILKIQDGSEILKIQKIIIVK